jgi:hypothetical protein
MRKDNIGEGGYKKKGEKKKGGCGKQEDTKMTREKEKTRNVILSLTPRPSLKKRHVEN